MSKVLITGGTGFVGRWMQRTAPLNFYVNVMSHQAYDEELTRWDWDWDYVVHLAPVSPTRALACAKRNRARMLFASSGAVYHDRPNTYGLDKIAWEIECKRSGADVVIARMFSFIGYGNHQASDDFILQALNGGPIRIKGDGQVIRSYLYAEDMAKWLWEILLSGRSMTTYDVGSDIPTTMLELAQMVSSFLIPEPEIVIENRISQERARVYLPKTAGYTCSELNLKQWTSLEEMVMKTVRDYSNARKLPTLQQQN